MIRKIFIFFILIASFSSIKAQNENEIIDRRKQAIQLLVETQVACWNEGDLKGYMEGYWKSDSMQFISPKGITFGYNQTLENYEKSWGAKPSLGRLSFRNLRIRPLDELKLLFQVTGDWMVNTETEEDAGHFSLIVRFDGRVPKIIIDHTF
jgi:hypothetical protein